jgi:pyrroline-5-carboxylate reductase
MKTPSIGFIGGGRITGILLQAFANKKINLIKATVYDINSEVTSKLKERFPDIHIGTLEEAASKKIVIICLHPPVIMEMLEKIAPFVTSETVLGSLAPKISSEKILSKLPQISKLVRMIPNATSIINEGYNPIWFVPDFPSDEKEIILQMLDFLGTSLEVEEKELEAYAIISAMAPTYFWFQWKKLAELGQELGLDHRHANEAVLQSMYGALETYFNTQMSPEEVMDLIPVKPIGEHEKEIEAIYEQKLKGLYAKIKSWD